MHTKHKPGSAVFFSCSLGAKYSAYGAVSICSGVIYCWSDQPACAVGSQPLFVCELDRLVPIPLGER